MILNVRAIKCHVWTYPTISKSPVEVFVNGINTFNWQKLSMITLSFSSEWLDRLISRGFKVHRYGISKWARLCHRNKELAAFKYTVLWCKIYQWSVMTKYWNFHAKIIDFVPQYHAQMLESGNVHTCSNSKLYNHTQSSGYHLDNRQFPIVLYVWPL